MARPRPDEEPVMMATLSCRRGGRGAGEGVVVVVDIMVDRRV